MTSEPENSQNQDLQKDILSGRKFSLADLIGREGGDFLKGESPVPLLVQATTAINLFIAQNLSDLSGALQPVLQNWVKADQAKVSHHLDNPLLALSEIIKEILDNEQLLYDLVKQVDFTWGQIYQEKPYFQKLGQQPHPDDEYTHESVRAQLTKLLNIVDSHKT